MSSYDNMYADPASPASSAVPALADRLCSGHAVLDFGPDPAAMFPWFQVRHSTVFNGLKLQVDRDHLVAFSSSCTGTHSNQDGTRLCSACSRASLDRLAWPTFAQRAHQSLVGSKTNYSYYNISQMREAIIDKTERLGGARLALFNKDKLILRLLDTDTMWRTISKTIAAGEIARVHAHLAQLQKRNASPRVILSRLVKAAKEGIRNRQFSAGEHDISLLMLRLGGPKLLHAVSRELGLPSISTVRRRARTTNRFIPTTHVETLYEDVKSNSDLLPVGFRLNSESNSINADANELPVIVIATDETKLREAVRYHHATNRVLGTCVEHASTLGDSTKLEVEDTASVVAVHSAVGRGDLHVAPYVSLTMLRVASRDGCITPIAALASCMKGNAETQATAYTQILSAVLERLPGVIPVRSIRVFATDGDSKRRSLLHSWFYGPEVNNTYNGCQLDGADLPLAVLKSKHGYDLGNVDWLHVIKRFRNTLLRPSGISVNGLVFDKEYCRTMLTSAGYQEARITTLLDAKDKMNVRTAVDLLRELVKAGDEAALHLSTHIDDRSVEQQRRLGLVLLSIILRPYLSVILPGTYVDATRPTAAATVLLQAQCTLFASSAAAAAMLFHTANPHTDFLPAVMFHDIQQNAMMVLQLCCKISTWLSDGINRHATVTLATLDTNCCEDMFSIIRGAIYDPNCDAMQFACRLSSALDVARAFDEHPSWVRNHSRSLDSSGDKISLKGVEEDVQNINATITIRHADVIAQRFSPKNAWQTGVKDVSVAVNKFVAQLRVKPESVWVDAASATKELLIMKLPSFMRRSDSSVIGVGFTDAPDQQSDEHDDPEQELDDQSDTDAESIGGLAPAADSVCELESAAIIDDPLESTHSKYCIVNGQRASKSSIVDSLFGARAQHGVPTDRLLRFQTPAQEGVRTRSLDLFEPALNTDDSECIAVLSVAAQPIVALLLRTTTDVIACLARVAQIQIRHVNSGSKVTLVDSISTSNLQDSRVHLRVLLFPATASTDAADAVKFDTCLDGGQVTVKGVTAKLLDISAAIQYTQEQITVPAAFLRDIGEQVWTQLTSATENEDPRLAALVALKSIGSISASAPVWSTIQSGPRLDTAQAFILEMQFARCRVCMAQRRPNSLRIHIADHMLDFAHKNDAKIASLCGFCGSDGQHSGGTCALTISGGVVRSHCELAPTATTRQVGFGSKLPIRCTNDLIACPQPQCKAGLFKYGLSYHLRTVHSIDSSPDALVAGGEEAFVKQHAHSKQRINAVVHLPGSRPHNKPRGRAGAATSSVPTSGAKRPRSSEPPNSEDGLSSSDSDAEMSDTDASEPLAKPASAPAPKPVPISEREQHIAEWTVYANTDAYVRDVAILLRHVTEHNDALAAAKRESIVQKLRATAETLNDALDQLSGCIDDDLAFDVGLDSVTHQETLKLHIQSHRTLADELAGRNFEEWRRTIVSEPRAARKTRNVVVAQ
jgi:hypothetical protein